MDVFTLLIFLLLKYSRTLSQVILRHTQVRAPIFWPAPQPESYLFRRVLHSMAVRISMGEVSNSLYPDWNPPISHLRNFVLLIHFNVNFRHYARPSPCSTPTTLLSLHQSSADICRTRFKYNYFLSTPSITEFKYISFISLHSEVLTI